MNASFPLAVALLFLGTSRVVSARDLHVDPLVGIDTQDGVALPVKTIGRAVYLSQPGDVIHLLGHKGGTDSGEAVVYHEWVAFFDKSGEKDKPITLDGHGAIIDGCEPLDAAKWTEVEPGLFRNEDLMPLTDATIERWFFVMGGKLNRMNRCSKGTSAPLKAPATLVAGEWTFVKDEARTKTARAGYIYGAFWLRLAPGVALADARIEFPTIQSGVIMQGTSSHLVIKNLITTRVYNDGFNLSDSQDVILENIQAINCGDDGISAHGKCQYQVDGLVSRGNATGICDTGSSETTYRHVTIQDCIGLDLFFLDTGSYSISDSIVISSAEKAVFMQGLGKPEKPCRLTMEKVIIRREKAGGEVRISENCILKARSVTFQNLDLLDAGGEVEMEGCSVGGVVNATPSRKPRIVLRKGSEWKGQKNHYDLESITLDQTVIAGRTSTEFEKLLASKVAP